MKRILSGSAPSGHLCIGNYLGALKNWVELQEEYDCIYVIVDLHAITTQQKPSELRKQSISFLAQYVACGIDPEKSTIVIQSHVSQHAELMWILSTLTYMGALNRMTQFKDKSKKHAANINAGLFTYPILMASDILLYQADLVPVGADQKQHLELARDLAIRFNSTYSDTFVVPEPCIPKSGARIKSLQEPEKKMSKSDENLNNLIAILDSADIVKRKIKRAVTDSGSEVRMDKSRSGISNLVQLYSLITDLSVKEVESQFSGKMYSDFKTDLGNVIADFLEPIQKKYNEISKDKVYLESVLEKGAENAFYRGRKTLSKVYRNVGIIQPAR